jgi:hypothetical protein
MIRFSIYLCFVFFTSSCSAQSASEQLFRSSHEVAESTKVNEEILFSSSNVSLFKYQVIGSHQLPFLIICDISEPCREVSNYDIESLVQMWNTLSINIDEDRRLQLLDNLIQVSRHHLEADGWDFLEGGE